MFHLGLQPGVPWAIGLSVRRQVPRVGCSIELAVILGVTSHVSRKRRVR